MAGSSNHVSWLTSSIFGAALLSLVTLIRLPLKLIAYFFRHNPEPVSWGELLAFPVIISGLGFVCGSVFWALQALPRLLGAAGDAIVGVLIMDVFFLSCMLVFGRPMLVGGEPGRGPMLLLGSFAGLPLGVWIGRDLRRELAVGNDQTET